MKRRLLDIVNAAEANEEKTNFILVDLHNFMKTGFNEIMALPENRTTM